MAASTLIKITLRRVDGRDFIFRYDFSTIPPKFLSKSGGGSWSKSADGLRAGEWSPTTDPVLAKIETAIRNGEFKQARELARYAGYMFRLTNEKDEK